MCWMICWNEEGGMYTDHYPEDPLIIATAIAPSRAEKFHPGYRARLLIWLRAAEIGDVLEFPQGIVVRTSEHATEIGYEETG